jgi:hypothetical protein
VAQALTKPKQTLNTNLEILLTTLGLRKIRSQEGTITLTLERPRATLYAPTWIETRHLVSLWSCGVWFGLRSIGLYITSLDSCCYGSLHPCIWTIIQCHVCMLLMSILIHHMHVCPCPCPCSCPSSTSGGSLCKNLRIHVWTTTIL